jgi:hypothetical protein
MEAQMVQVICNPSRNTISFGSLPILQFNIFFILLTEEEKGEILGENARRLLFQNS